MDLKDRLDAMHALEELRQNYEDGTHLFDDDLLDIIENDIKKREKKVKALKIIIDKRVDVDWLMYTKNVREYNESVYVYDVLTEEEFNSLKEVLYEESKKSIR